MNTALMINAEWNLTEDFLSAEAFSSLTLASTCGVRTSTRHSFARPKKGRPWMEQLVGGINGV
jgi:hypothetical protein